MVAIAHSKVGRAGAANVPPPGAGGHEAVKSAAASAERDESRLKRQFETILKGVRSHAVEGAVQHVLGALTRLREILRLVELNVEGAGPVEVTLAAFAFAERESRALVKFIEATTPKVKAGTPPLREALDGMSFAIRHEMKTVFGRDLAALAAGRTPEEARTDFMRAHGLLSNCFQQSILTLARVFDPSVRGEFLFEDYRARFRQSAVLLRELAALGRLARRAQTSPGSEAADLLLRELAAFCQGSIYYLMYKDWDEFEDIAREVAASHGSARHGFVLHCFATYLDALVSQVRMRSVLNDQEPAPAEPKRPKKQEPKRRRRGTAASYE